MKKIKKIAAILLLTAIVALTLASCGTDKNTASDSSAVISGEESAAKTEVSKTGVWEDAVYFTDTEFGQGSKTVTVVVSAEKQSVTFTIHTDAATVGEALLENELISGDEGQYGLYVKKVNGMTADYDIDKSYWAFWEGSAFASNAVDKTDITEGTVYKLEYTK